MPTDFVSVSVTRSEYSLGDLSIIPENGYYIARNGIGPGGLQHDKVYATSPFVDGSFLTYKRKEMTSMSVIVNVRANNASQLHGRIETLTHAFEQFGYTMTVTIDGVTYQWECETADYEIGDGGAWDDLQIRSFYQTVGFDVPRFPG